MYAETPLGRTCIGLAIILGCFLISVIEVVIFIATGTKITGHEYFIWVFTGVILLCNLITYYIYSKKKRYQFVTSSQYNKFTWKRNTGVAISVAMLISSMILLAVVSIVTVD